MIELWRVWFGTSCNILELFGKLSFPGHKRLENWAEGSKKALPLIIKFGASRDYVALKSHAIDNNEERNEMGERNKNRKESRKKAKEGQ